MCSQLASVSGVRWRQFVRACTCVCVRVRVSVCVCVCHCRVLCVSGFGQTWRHSYSARVFCPVTWRDRVHRTSQLHPHHTLWLHRVSICRHTHTHTRKRTYRLGQGEMAHTHTHTHAHTHAHMGKTSPYTRGAEEEAKATSSRLRLCASTRRALCVDTVKPHVRRMAEKSCVCVLLCLHTGDTDIDCQIIQPSDITLLTEIGHGAYGKVCMCDPVTHTQTHRYRLFIFPSLHRAGRVF